MWSYAQQLNIAARLMMRVIKFHVGACAIVLFLLLPFPGRAAGPEQGKYDTGFETIVRLAGNLHHTLDRQVRPQLLPAPVLLEKLALPYLQIHESGPHVPSRAIYLSSGFVDLLNFISHAEAIDGSSPGFLVKSMSRVASMQPGNQGLPDLQANTVRDSWSFGTMNHQASSFNQMAGGLVAVQVAHISLGHYQKYAGLLATGQHIPLPLNSLITPAEWRDAVLQAAARGLECGLAVDGLKAVFESIDKMPVRPVWRIYFMPNGVGSKELSKLNNDLDRLQKKTLLSFAR